MRIKRFGETLPVRLPEEIDRRLKLIASVTGLSKSDVLRIAINHGLPAVESGKLCVTPS